MAAIADSPPPNGAAAASRQVWTGRILSALVAAFLRGCHAVERLEDWLPRRAELPAGALLCGARGQLLGREVLIHFSPDSRTHGVIEREREIDALAGELAALEDEAGEAHGAMHAAEQLAAGLQDEASGLRREAQSTQAAVHAAQVEALDIALAETGTALDAVIALVADPEVLVARMLKRAQEQGRDDDNADSIRHRIEVYHAQTADVIALYRDRGIVLDVDAIGSVDEVRERIFAAVDGLVGAR